MSMHAEQIPINVDIVCRLVREQFPEWGELTVLDIHSEGTLNAIFRIGSDLAARFQLLPRELLEVRADLDAEAALGRELSEHSSFPVPRPVAIGRPGTDYPLPWSVQTWVPGTTATRVDAAGSVPFARDLATFIAEVRSIDMRGRVFTGRGRGGDLVDHDEWMETCFDESEELLDVPVLRARWSRLRELPGHAGDVMCHGDLTPGNVLVREGRLSGVIDTGGLGAADPSLDLVSAWHLLDDDPRASLRAQLQCDDLEWERGKAWAFQQAMGLVWYYRTSNPAMSRWGRRTLERLIAAETP